MTRSLVKLHLALAKVFHFPARLEQRDSWAQPSDRVVNHVRGQSNLLAESKASRKKIASDRHPERGVSRYREAGRHHAGHHVGLPIDSDRGPEGGRACVEVSA